MADLTLVEDYNNIPLFSDIGFKNHIKTLTPSQKEFVVLLNSWLSKRDHFLFVIVSGGPGSGKTHTVVETLKHVNLRVVKMAPTARLAKKIGGRTYHSTMRLNWKRGSTLYRLTKTLAHCQTVEECLSESHVLKDEFQCYMNPDIVVIDEIGMLPFWLTYQMCQYFRHKRKAIAVICMGDKDQLRPVTSKCNVFHVPFDEFFRTERISMVESKRFTPQYESIVNHLKKLMTVPAPTVGDHAMFQYVERMFPVRPSITHDMLFQANRVLAYTNSTVKSCNDFYIDVILRHEQEFDLVPMCSSNSWAKNCVRLRKNCSVVITENGCADGFYNGTSMKFLDYDAEFDVALCEDDETGKLARVRRSEESGMIPLVPGFAVTVHKFQGQTIDEENIVMCFDRSNDLNLIYTALSRVRSMSQILAVIL